MAMYQFTEDQLHGNMKDVVDMRYGHSPRELCGIWNHKLSHLHGPKFLVQRFFDTHDPTTFPNLIIPDVRFSHDCYEIRRRGGILVKVVREKFPLQLEDENHIDGLVGDVTIANDANIETLQKRIREHVVPLIKT